MRDPVQRIRELEQRLRSSRLESTFFGVGLLGTLLSGALLEGDAAMAGVVVAWFAAAGAAHALYGGE